MSRFFRPCFKNILVSPVVKQKKKKDTEIILTTTEEEQEKYTLCKVEDYSKDCNLFKSYIMENTERYIVVESHMIQHVEVEGKIYSMVSENAVVMISSEM